MAKRILTDVPVYMIKNGNVPCIYCLSSRNMILELTSYL